MLNTNGSPWPIAHSRSPSPASSTPAIATTHQRESRAPGAAPRRTGISAADARTAQDSRSEVSSEGTDEGGHPGANPRSVPEGAAYQGGLGPTGLGFSLRVATVMPRTSACPDESWRVAIGS